MTHETAFVQQFKRDAAALGHRNTIRLHLGWLKTYAACMNERNWLDTKDRIERQIGELERELFPNGEQGHTKELDT